MYIVEVTSELELILYQKCKLKLEFEIIIYAICCMIFWKVKIQSYSRQLYIPLYNENCKMI